MLDVACTLQEVKLDLAKEEAEERGRGDLQVHDTSPNSFLYIGLEIEEQQ